jgi:hypothetical protein
VTGTVAVGVLGLGALAVISFRAGILPAPATGMSASQAEVRDPAANDGAPIAKPDPVLRFPRLLFYLGALLLTESSLRVAFGLTAGEIFFVGAFSLTVLAVLAGRPAASVPTGLVAGVGIVAFGGLISSPNAASPAGSVIEVLQVVYVMLLWAWTGATVLRNRRQIITALTMWTMSAAINGFYAIAQALTGSLGSGRTTGLTPHPNDLGGACAVALIPALMLATSRFPGQGARLGPLERALRWGILGLVVAGLVLSVSVTAMLASFVGIVIWTIAPVVRAPARLAVVIGLAFAVMTVTLVGGRVISPTDRIQTVTGSSGSGSGSVDARLKTVQRAFTRIQQDPVIGAGFDKAGGVVTVINKGSNTQIQVHSAPVAAWYEAGILGLIGLLVVAATLAKTAWRSVTHGVRDDMLIGVAIFAAGIAWVVIAVTSPLNFQQYGWFAAVMAVALSARRMEAAEVFVTTERGPQAMPAMVVRPLPY